MTYKHATEFVKRKHKGQVRAGNTPAFYHLLRVYFLLDFVLRQTGEGSVKERKDILLAALGHDLLEDTLAKKEEIARLFGEDALRLILSLTNTWGDKRPAPYVKQMVGAPEAARLIKLADLYDNISHVTYCFRLLERKWITAYFLPIVLPMKKAIIKTRFRRYNKSSRYLIGLVEAASNLLEKELAPK